ncbi:MAG: AAA family ATPase, partial [Alphaproteobacteria bacterium]
MTIPDYERTLACRFAARLANSFERTSRPARKLIDWLETYEGYTGLNLEEVAAVRLKSGKRRRRPPGERAPGPQAWKQIVEALEQAGRRRRAKNDDFGRNVSALGNALELKRKDMALLDFVGRCSGDLTPLAALADDMVGTHAMDSASVTACCLGMDVKDVRRRLTKGKLPEYGLTGVRRAFAGCYAYYLNWQVYDALSAVHDGIEDIERTLIGEPLSTRLTAEDFEHVGREIAFAARLLRQASAERAQGVNLLLYGAPGTGKTELSKLLAREAGLQLFAVGENRRENYEPDREDRIESLLLAGRIALRRAGSVLLFDEMEDLLEDGEFDRIGSRVISRAGSKVFMNRVLENNRVPVIWIANTLYGFDPAFLRRMSFALELRLPGRTIRRRQWQKAADARKIPLSEEEADRLSRAPAAPGIMTNALDAVRLVQGSTGDLRLVADSITRAMGGRRTPENAGAGRVAFAGSLLNADTNLGALERQLCRADAPRDVSFCFHGPPGTGKTAYVRHLADLMKIDVLHKRASDLMSPFVGETEQLIAEAFEEARRTETFLVFDEADSLLADRRGAFHSWEVSQVNEMLTWMESHPLPFACTTNLMSWVDTASIRRFSFKVRFDFLRKEQSREAFELFFGLKPPEELDALQTLTPGDFAVVRAKTRFLPEEAESAQALLAHLEQECA